MMSLEASWKSCHALASTSTVILRPGPSTHISRRKASLGEGKSIYLSTFFLCNYAIDNPSVL